MRKLKLGKINDDASIYFDEIMDEEEITIEYFINTYDGISYEPRHIQNKNFNIQDYIENVNVDSLTEKHFIKSLIENIDLNGWIKNIGYYYFVPYAPPSFEYHSEGDLMVIHIYFYHDIQNYNKIIVSSKFLKKRYISYLIGLYTENCCEYHISNLTRCQIAKVN